MSFTWTLQKHARVAPSKDPNDPPDILSILWVAICGAPGCGYKSAQDDYQAANAAMRNHYYDRHPEFHEEHGPWLEA